MNILWMFSIFSSCQSLCEDPSYRNTQEDPLQMKVAAADAKSASMWDVAVPPQPEDERLKVQLRMAKEEAQDLLKHY